MLKREIDSRLREWKADKNHKALLLTGARQVGKTYSVRKFAEQEYENFVEINFIENESAQDIFSDVSNVDMIITNLTARISVNTHSMIKPKLKKFLTGFHRN